ncbi:MAG: ABC transporter substrate-binding protein [Chloroflexi bacterium]|nr:ABC transporter substrate-binding protein [Chloroflexota bacterium]MYD48778.1 ABC transporter substrate-binding protein [Chloroflexota bacterium]
MIKAGIPVSLTGQFATQGLQALAGLTAWVEYFNARGGLTLDGQSHQLTLTHYDDVSLTEGVQRATERLIKQDEVDLLFGPYSAGLTTAAAEVAESQGKLMWNHGGAGDALYARGYRNVIGVLTPADQYLVGAPALARQANPEASKLVILRIDTGAFARLVARGVESTAHAMGFTTELDLRYRPSQTRFTEIARAVAELQPDLVVCVGRIRHDVATARALVSLPNRSSIGLAVVVAAPIAVFADQLGSDADGFIGPTQWEPAVSVPQPDVGPDAGAALRILEIAGAASGLAVDYPMAQAFAAGIIAERCAQEAGSVEGDDLREAATSLDFTTFYGRFRIDETGRQVGRSVALVQRQEGRKVVVWPAEQAEGPVRWPF